jgi:hypothetical protein
MSASDWGQYMRGGWGWQCTAGKARINSYLIFFQQDTTAYPPHAGPLFTGANQFFCEREKSCRLSLSIVIGDSSEAIRARGVRPMR